MTDGYWRIKQYSPTAKNGHMVTSIPVAQNGPTLSDTEPSWRTTEWGITINYIDGHDDHYPWASIIRAEYQPPTHEKRGT